MSRALPSPPPGYEALEAARACVVAQAAVAGTVAEVMARGTLYDWAAACAGARALAGRGTAWAAVLPGGVEIVVRHSRHGGALAALTGDIFLFPSRAPRELAASVRLAAAGVATPSVAAYAVYPAAGVFCRADVATRTLRGADFPDAWRAARDGRQRDALLDAVALLLRALHRAGAEHPDLNLKNIFLTSDGDEPRAFVLDVDRVVFGEAGDTVIAGRNLARLVRSARKWRGEWGLQLGETELLRLAAAAGQQAPGRAT